MLKHQPINIDASGFNTNGEAVEVLWKAWRHPGGSVWWGFLKVSDTLELTCHAKDTRLSTWLRANLAGLTHEWELAGLSASDDFLHSERAFIAQRKRGHEQAFAEDAVDRREVPVMSSKALLICLMYLHKFRRERSLRTLTIEVTRLWCARMLGSNLLQTDWLQIPAAICSTCPQSDHAAPCCHLAELGQELISSCSTPQVKVLNYVSGLSIGGSRCSAARAWWQHCCTELGANIDKDVEGNAYSMDPAAARPSMGRPVLKHNHDEDLRVAVARTAVADGRARSSSSFVLASPNVNCDPSTASRWEDSCTLVYQSAGWKLGEEIQTLSIAMDAGRFGSPAENTEVFAAAGFCRDGKACFMWLPPQAPTLHHAM